MTDLRVLQVMLSRKNGGAETYCADAIEGLHAAGIDQVLVIHPGAGRYAGLSALGQPMPVSHAFQVLPGVARWTLARAIRRYRPTVIYCWMRRAAEALPDRHPPAIGWFGGYYDVARFRRCEWFVGVTPDLVRHIASAGIPTDRVRDIHTFSSIDPAPPVDRASLGTPADAVVSLILSRLHPKKGIDIAIRALAKLPNHWLWVAGDGPLEGDLRALAAELGVLDRVRLLGWRTDRGALLAAADICLLPSRWEPFGTVIVEAWAAGVPLIATAAAGPAATVRDGVDGLLVPIDDVEALAIALARTAMTPDLAARMVESGRARFAADFSKKGSITRLIDLYRTASSAHREGA